jgi:hypothetical protein
MDQNHCTALVLYVAFDFLVPQHSRKPPRTTFLALPKEIRDEIHELVLVSASPIVIWLGVWKVEFLDEDMFGMPHQPFSKVLGEP